MLSAISQLLPDVFLSPEQQRLACLAKSPTGALKDYLSVPLPDKERPLGELDVLSLDFETTGMNAAKDQLLSIGCVDLHQGKIDLSSSHHQIIRTTGKLMKDNVAIHQITDAEKERGKELVIAFEELLRLMAGKVILVHFAKIERNFLQEACKRIYGIVPPFVMIDTLAIVRRRMDKKGEPYHASNLRLVNLRSSFNLPTYYAHNALKDAIATAELLLAELYNNHKGLQTPLAKLV